MNARLMLGLMIVVSSVFVASTASSSHLGNHHKDEKPIIDSGPGPLEPLRVCFPRESVAELDENQQKELARRLWNCDELTGARPNAGSRLPVIVVRSVFIGGLRNDVVVVMLVSKRCLVEHYRHDELVKTAYVNDPELVAAIRTIRPERTARAYSGGIGQVSSTSIAWLQDERPPIGLSFDDNGPDCLVRIRDMMLNYAPLK